MSTVSPRIAAAIGYIRPPNPLDLFGSMGYEAIPYVLVFGLIGVVCFLLSVRCYKEHDDTPTGLRVLYGLVAAGWNVLYIVFYFLRASMGGGC